MNGSNVASSIKLILHKFRDQWTNMKSERPWGKVYIASPAFNPYFMLLQDLLMDQRDKLTGFDFHLILVSYCRHIQTWNSWSHFFTGSLPFSFLAKRTQFTFLFCLHTSALMIFWFCVHRSRTREVGSEERRLWKSFYCLSLSPSFLTDFCPTSELPKLLSSCQSATWLLLFNNCTMGEEMVKFKAKKDSGKNVIFSHWIVFTLYWMLKMVSIDFRAPGFVGLRFIRKR